MLRIKDLTDEEFRELLSKPLTEVEAEALTKINQEARWLLALNLREMEDEGSIQAIRVKIPRKFRKR